MAAYAAVCSLGHTIAQLRQASCISFVPPSKQILKFALLNLVTLEDTLCRPDGESSKSRTRVNSLDRQMREAVCNLEDLIESHLATQIVSQSESAGDETTHPLLFIIDLRDLEQDILSFSETVKKMEEEFTKELDTPLCEEEDNAAVSSKIDFGGKKSKMVGLSDMFQQLKYWLTGSGIEELGALNIYGMAGIGKTTLANEIFEDQDIIEWFDCRVWVEIGQNCQLKEIPRGILAQVDPDKEKLITKGDEEVTQYLKNNLKDKRYLIILDDVWDKQVWEYLKSSLPEDHNGSRILLTTRLMSPRSHVDRSEVFLQMRFLNEEESWDLFREKMFPEESFSSELEKAGKKIVEKCDGLPLMIITVADLLSKTEKTPEQWNEVAMEKESSLFMDAYEEISKVLSRSYEFLPQFVKTFFLYMGVFPPKYETRRSKLIQLWAAEGLTTEPSNSNTCFLEFLLASSLVVPYEVRAIKVNTSRQGLQAKACGLHSTYLYLCKREAERNNFFHILNSLEDGLKEGIESQRRLCVQNNILFGIKDVRSSIENNCAFTVRSLLCFGRYHQYPVPIFFGLRLLKVVDVLTIRFYEFPMEVLQLILLRYLALTYDGNIPASISKLWNLQFLIVGRHLSINSFGAPSYQPIEIWDMKELKHLQIMGSDLLYDPNSCGLLSKLSKLLDVSAHSCTKGVLRKIRNLKKLRIRIELVPNDDGKALGCLNRISRLRKLKSLTCVIVNPEFGSAFVPSHAPRSMFPSCLKKLSLSGFGYPWEYMTMIATLPNLKVLKLQCYAFRGPKWEIQDNGFKELMYLLIEDTNLVQWKVGFGSFPQLEWLGILHCYRLEELHWESDYYPDKIKVVDSNVPYATWEKLEKEADSRDKLLQIYLHSSWDKRNLEL